MQNSDFASIDISVLAGVTGGAGADPAAWEKMKKQAGSAPMGFGKKILAIMNENGPPESPEAAQALGKKVMAVIPSAFRGMAEKQMGSKLAELFPGQGAGATALA